MPENRPVTDTADVAVENLLTPSTRMSHGDVLGTAHSAHHSSGNFPGIGDYAFLSDCEANCLIAPSGAIEWMCIPRPDSPSVFTALLDRAGGSFRVAPFGVAVPAARRYLPGTLVLETTWQTPTGWLIVRDALIMAPWHNTDQRSKTHRRSPTDYDAAHVLLRTIKCVYGNVDLQMSCEPVFDYARKGAKWTLPEVGLLRGRRHRQGPADAASCPARCGSASRAAPRLARTKMKRGRRALCRAGVLRPAGARGHRARPRTGCGGPASTGGSGSARAPSPTTRGASYLQSSALALKGLSYAPTGALLAAATTSLPETPGGERNWDYRYTWIRDSTFALWGLYTLGFDREANDFFYFIHDVCRDNPNDLQIMYGVGGERHLEEGTLDHLTGYDDARPVRIGNGAYNQQQHDVWGALLDSIYLHTRSREQMPEELWPIVIAQVEQGTPDVVLLLVVGAIGRCMYSLTVVCLRVRIVVAEEHREREPAQEVSNRLPLPLEGAEELGDPVGARAVGVARRVGVLEFRVLIDPVEAERLGSVLLVNQRDRLAVDGPVVALDDEVLAGTFADEFCAVVREPEFDGECVPVVLPREPVGASRRAAA